MHKHDTFMQMPLGGVFVHACRKQQIGVEKHQKKSDHIWILFKRLVKIFINSNQTQGFVRSTYKNILQNFLQLSQSKSSHLVGLYWLH